MKSFREKIVDRHSLSRLREPWRAEGKKTGFTSGVFDLIHRGHVEYLEQAKKLCDILIVGINSDLSVKEYKGDKRPVSGESDRASVLASLSCVDYVFIFPERRNRENIKALKPDIYIKAGDYNKEELTSAPLVESYGGRVEIVPFVKGYSSSKLIKEVLKTYTAEAGVYAEFSARPRDPAPAVFLDRDGVINEEAGYLHDPKKFKFIPGSLEGVKALYDKGYRIIVVTNQPGIGLGYYEKEDFFKVNSVMLKALSSEGILIDKIYFCPHSKAEQCRCRKPSPAMIERGLRELNIIPEKSFMIGDKTSDIAAGRAAGLKTILVKTGFGGSDNECKDPPDHTAKNLLEAAHMITASEL